MRAICSPSLATEMMMSVDDKTPNGLSFRHKSDFVEHKTQQPKTCCSEAKWWLDLWKLFAHQVSLLRQWFLLTIRCQMAWALDTNLILWNTKLYNPKSVVLRPGLRSGGWIYEGYLLTKSRYWSITNEAVTVPELFFPAPRWSMQCRIKEKSLPTTKSGWKDFWMIISIFFFVR